MSEQEPWKRGDDDEGDEEVDEIVCHSCPLTMDHLGILTPT